MVGACDRLISVRMGFWWSERPRGRRRGPSSSFFSLLGDDQCHLSSLLRRDRTGPPLIYRSTLHKTLSQHQKDSAAKRCTCQEENGGRLLIYFVKQKNWGWEELGRKKYDKGSLWYLSGPVQKLWELVFSNFSGKTAKANRINTRSKNDFGQTESPKSSSHSNSAKGLPKK